MSSAALRSVDLAPKSQMDYDDIATTHAQSRAWPIVNQGRVIAPVSIDPQACIKGSLVAAKCCIPILMQMPRVLKRRLSALSAICSPRLEHRTLLFDHSVVGQCTGQPEALISHLLFPQR